MPLFDPPLPEGFLYRPDFISADEERTLCGAIAQVSFETFVMRGVAAKRRVKFYGVAYDERPAGPMPDFLLWLRARLAHWAGVAPGDYAMALINEYPQGATIGWHRDAPQYGITAGVSLLSEARMKLRPYVSPGDPGGTPRRAPRKTTHELLLPPRSAYLMTGPSRSHYEHSVPPTPARRYSITFRTLRA